MTTAGVASVPDLELIASTQGDEMVGTLAPRPGRTYRPGNG